MPRSAETPEGEVTANSRQKRTQRIVSVGRAAVLKNKISIVTGTTVRRLRDILDEAGFGNGRVGIQGVDIDELDKGEVWRVLGDEVEDLKQLPIAVVGIGTKSLATILRPIQGVKVIPGGFGDLRPIIHTLPTITATTTPAEILMMTIATITLTPFGESPTPIPPPAFNPAQEPLVLEGISRTELERTLSDAGFDLDKIRVRPLRSRDGRS